VRDLIVTARTIYTAEPSTSSGTAMVVRDRRITYVGNPAFARASAATNAAHVDFGDAVIVPGFVDAHAHLLGLGLTMSQLNLVDCPSFAEVVSRTEAWARGLPPGTWIRGYGWDQNLWPNRDFPTHDLLSAALPENPLILDRIDGHALLANLRAMQLAGADRAAESPDGGQIVRDAAQAPTGVFIDAAMNLIRRAAPRPSHEEFKRGLLAAISECHRLGVTGIHEPGVDDGARSLYEELARDGRLDLRAYLMLNDDAAQIAAAFERGPQNALHDGRVWVRAIKLYADGALGSRGAALFRPYTDSPDGKGLLLTDAEHLESVTTRALRHGFQVATHAIGDRANRLVLDAYENALKAMPTDDHRLRIEHAQVLACDDIPRFRDLGVVPSMQTSHQASDMAWAEEHLGAERVGGAFAWRSLLDTGVTIANGTDCPIEPLDPMNTFHAAVTRQDADGNPPNGWHPEQRMTRDEALKSMTLWAARAGFQERELGSIAPGKYADFVVLDRDIMSIPHDEILSTKVLATYFAGRPVYAGGSQAGAEAIAGPRGEVAKLR